jgi:hypothetical protein
LSDKFLDLSCLLRLFSLYSLIWDIISRLISTSAIIIFSTYDNVNISKFPKLNVAGDLDYFSASGNSFTDLNTSLSELCLYRNLSTLCISSFNVQQNQVINESVRSLDHNHGGPFTLPSCLSNTSLDKLCDCIIYAFYSDYLSQSSFIHRDFSASNVMGTLPSTFATLRPSVVYSGSDS